MGLEAPPVLRGEGGGIGFRLHGQGHGDGDAQFPGGVGAEEVGSFRQAGEQEQRRVGHLRLQIRKLPLHCLQQGLPVLGAQGPVAADPHHHGDAPGIRHRPAPSSGCRGQRGLS